MMSQTERNDISTKHTNPQSDRDPVRRHAQVEVESHDSDAFSAGEGSGRRAVVERAS
jgi:hypothetical protein